MINMMKFDYIPSCIEWVYSPGDAISAVAISEQDSSKIHIYDGQGTEFELHVFDKLHTKSVVIMKVILIFLFYISFFLN